MDQEFDDFASAMELVLTRDGQNEPSNDLPMGGNKHTNVGAATSVEEYLRANEFLSEIPILVFDGSNTSTVLSASVEFYATVSAGQAPPNGARLRVVTSVQKYTNSSVSATLNLVTPTGTHAAPIHTFRGARVHSRQIMPGHFHDFIYSSASAAWHLQNPRRGYEAFNAVPKGKNAAGTVTGVGATVALYVNSDDDVVTLAQRDDASVSVSASTRRFIFSVAGDLPVSLQDVSNSLTDHQVIVFRASGQKLLPLSVSWVTLSSVTMEDPSLLADKFILSANETFYIPPWTGTFFVQNV